MCEGTLIYGQLRMNLSAWSLKPVEKAAKAREYKFAPEIFSIIFAALTTGFRFFGT